MTFTIAVTGHRPNRISGEPEVLGDKCRELLSAAKRDFAFEDDAIAVSALAEGADRIFAKAALEEGYELHVVIPFDEGEYKKTFQRQKNSAYDILVHEAARTEMVDGDPTNPEAAYRELGDELIRRADLVVAIWDGNEEISIGGTADVIDRAKAAGKPVVWIHSDGEQPLKILLADRIAEIDPDELHRFVHGHPED